jgi:hypothetical protein
LALVVALFCTATAWKPRPRQQVDDRSPRGDAGAVRQSIFDGGLDEAPCRKASEIVVGIPRAGADLIEETPPVRLAGCVVAPAPDARAATLTLENG